ncbi:protein PRRC2C isoform X3 [Phymastichus coffea]|uniref:protein PRRC2C isoform X3 n=1 Tax=Phymastichus coffea TaxID=108790 RepID=UPI00273BECB4|nr:protein PRRC2C isoform X3 [Phymastichus coffea]
MSTLSGIASKGEKGKTKYQSIDINSLYRSSRGESLEQHQQKNTVPRKHGMQSLGKVPSARRPPANLPSLKSETSSSDPAVSLVPTGGSGWATTKDLASTTNTVTTISNTPSDNTATNVSPAQCMTGPPSVISQQHPPLPGQQSSSHPSEAGNKSSWSAIMSRPGDVVGYAGLVESGRGGGRGGAGLSFLAHQSPQFQHEFPSLSGGQSSSLGTSPPTANHPQQQQQQNQISSGVVQHQSMLQQQQNYSHNHSGGGPTGQQPQQNRENAQYGPGPSLRPQTEGSWIQGGSRIAGNQQQQGGAIVGPGVVGTPNIPVGQVPLVGPNAGPLSTVGQQPQDSSTGGRASSGPSPAIITGPAGQPNNQPSQGPPPNMHHYRGIIPPFMYRGNNFPAQFPAGGPRPRGNYPEARGGSGGPNARASPPVEKESIITRPIIKEEDLSRMDDISRDAGWAASDDIDYNQKLTFSDDEPDNESSDKRDDNHHYRRQHQHQHQHHEQKQEQENKHAQDEKDHANAKEQKDSNGGNGPPMRSWNNQGPLPRDYRGPPPAGYSPQPSMRPGHAIRQDEEELWNHRSERVSENIASAVERARQRKEEEEKRFQELTKQAAAKKLQDLENKLKEKRKKDEEQQKSKDPNDAKSTPAIPVPEWDSRFRTSSTDVNKDQPLQQQQQLQASSKQDSTSEFRQIDRPSFVRQSSGDQSTATSTATSTAATTSAAREPAFSRHFQSNLPPRFQKQQQREAAERGGGGTGATNNTNTRLTPSPSQANLPFSQQYDPSRWAHNHSNSLSKSMAPVSEDRRRSDERHRPNRHGGGGGGERGSGRDGYYDDYPPRRGGGDRGGGGDRFGKDYDYEDNRHTGNWADHAERRGYDDKDGRERDLRDKKDYDNYSKDYNEQAANRDHGRESNRSENSGGPEWRSSHGDDTSSSNNQRRTEENRPQRPDSRDSRASRDSRQSLRGDDDFHKSGSWANDFSDYEEGSKKNFRDEPSAPPVRDRRQPAGPVTKDKLDQEEIKRGMTSLKRGGPDPNPKKDQDSGKSSIEQQQQSSSMTGGSEANKKDNDVWNRNKSTPDPIKSNTSWADSIPSPTFEKEEEEKRLMAAQNNDADKKIGNLKQGMEKLNLDGNKRSSSDLDAEKDEQKDDKRDKNARNRASSSGSRGPRGGEPRGNRQWGSGRESNVSNQVPVGGQVQGSGSFSNAYGQRWRGNEPPARGGGGRRSGGNRMGGSGRSGKGGNYERTDSELSGDEIIREGGGGSLETGKDDRRPSTARSPKPSAHKGEKDERNRNAASTRKDEAPRQPGEFSQPPKKNERSASDLDSRRPAREGFAPSGEPSRRGRGGFRNNRGGPPAATATSGGSSGTGGGGSGGAPSSAGSGGRIEGYGPPPSKSPFSSGDDNKQFNVDESGNNAADHHSESTDDKIIAKQQALTAGITGGRHTKSPNQMNQPLDAQGKPLKKDDSRSKRTRSGSRRTRGGGGRGINAANKNSADIGAEEWETTSENSEEHANEKKDGHGGRKGFGGRGDRQNAVGNNGSQHGREPRGNREPRGDKGPKSSNPQLARDRAPVSEKGRNSGPPRNHNIPPLMQNSQVQNGRPRSQGSANSGPIGNIKNIINKDTTVNRIDEIKLNDPNLVNQALNDINKSKEKRDVDVDSNCVEEGVSAGDDKVDADGFQEVRSKKNVKDSRGQQQKDEQQTSKPSGRRDKERERDRSKSKSNGAQNQQGLAGQQGQNSTSQTIGQAGAGAPPKQYERNANRQKLAPRFQKARLAKQQQQQVDGADGKPLPNATKEGAAPPPPVNAWDKPFTSGSRSPPAVPADIQLMSGLTAAASNEQDSTERNSPKVVGEKSKDQSQESKTGQDATSSPPVHTLIFENTNYTKSTKSNVTTQGPSDMAIKPKYSNHVKPKRSSELDDESSQLQQQQALAVAFSSKPSDLIKDKQPDPIQMPLSFNNKEDSSDMKLDFTFDSDLSQLTDDKSKTLGMPRSMHITSGQSTISPSTAELNLKIASVKKVWENAPPMPTVVEHEVDQNVVSSANSFPQAFENNDDDSYITNQQYNQGNMKNEITTSTNICKLVPPQVKPQQQTSGGGGVQPGSSVPGPSPIGPGQSPIGHPPANLQGPLSPPPFNSTSQPSHINYQYPGSQAAAAQYGSMSAIPSPPAVLFNTNSGQLPAQAAGGLYGAFQLDQSRSPFTQYPPYAASLQSSFNQQNMYLQQAPPPHAPNAPTPDIYQSNLSQYRLQTAAAAPPFGQNQQLSNNPNTVLISSSSNSLMSASVKPTSQPIGAIGTKAPHFQAPSAPPQPNQLAYIPYDPNQVLGVSGSYMGNSQLVQRPGPNVQPSANNYYNATSADVFSGSQTGYYQPGGAAQQTGAHYSLQGFGQHSQSLTTGNAAPVGLQNFSSQFLSGSGLQIAAAAAAQQYRNPTGGLPGPANAAATFLNKHQQQDQPRQLKSPSGNQQDVLASVFSSTPQIPSPKSRKQQSSSQQPQPSPTQHHKFQQYQGVSQSALVGSYNNYQNVQRGMGMPRGGIQPSQQRYPPPIQRPVVPFPPGPNNSQQGQQQQNCMPNQQSQMNRHRPNIHQQQPRNMKIQQQYYSGQSNVKMDSNDKVDSHNDKINDVNTASQAGPNKNSANLSETDNKEEISQQNE